MSCQCERKYLHDDKIYIITDKSLFDRFIKLYDENKNLKKDIESLKSKYEYVKQNNYELCKFISVLKDEKEKLQFHLNQYV